MNKERVELFLAALESGMTGTQQLIGWICTLGAVLAGYALYLAATYGFGQNKENK